MYSIIINLTTPALSSEGVKNNADLYIEIGTFLKGKRFEKETLGVFMSDYSVDLCIATTTLLELLVLMPEIKKRASILKIQENGHSIDMRNKLDFLDRVNYLKE